MARFISIAVEGISSLVNKLRERLSRSRQKDDGSFTVGYAAPYALFVHENLQAHHEHGQAKFLEQPTRQLHNELATTIRREVSKNLGLEPANKSAAIQLLQASQELAPTDLGVLKASGYVRDKNDNTVFGSEESPETILAWRQLLQDQEHRSQQLKQNRKVK